MEINGIVINTPHDADVGADLDPDWRRKVAVAWVDNNRWFPPKYIYDDIYIRRYREYIRALKCVGSGRLPERFKELQSAEAWYAGGDRKIKGLLEPLLLTDIRYKVIASDVVPNVARQHGKTPNPENDRIAWIVELYEKLFFNIRDDRGLVNESVHTRAVFALRGLALDAQLPASYTPRVVAAFFGYTALMYLLYNAKYAHGEVEGIEAVRNHIYCSTQAHMMARVVKNDMNNFDSIALLGQNIAHDKMLFDTKAHERSQNTYRDSWEALMEMRKPKLIQAAITVDEKLRMDAQYLSDFHAKKNITEHGAVKDAGVEGQAKAWMANKNAHFKDIGVEVPGKK